MDELGYFVKISNWWRALNEAQESSIIDNSQGAGDIHVITQRHQSHQKLAMISEIEVGVFVDCVVEVSKVS